MRTKYIHITAEYPGEIKDCLIDADTFVDEGSNPADWLPGEPDSITTRALYIESEHTLPDYFGA